jgi:RNA polymerase sigma-70 factor (ECF subfamily)
MATTNSIAAAATETHAEQCEPTGWVDQYGDFLYNFAVGQVRDPHLAEDLVQETFLAALKSRDRFAGRSSVRTWLVSILRHKIYDHLRSSTRRKTVALENPAGSADDSLCWVHEIADECARPDHHIELAEFRASLEIALGKLPPRVAQAFEMYEINDQSAREVCQELRITESNLWVMLHRARKQLRVELEPAWSSKPAAGPLWVVGN